ncbi:TetR/AcrR family transcriptional regulator [Cellulomonas sp. NPDC055163]
MAEVARRGGRRSGQSGTREAILGSARAQFAEHGFDRATIRGIATAAGVDPALVHHFFGSKDELFAAALELPFDAAVMPDLLAGDPDGVGERVVRHYLGVWADPVTGPHLQAVFRSVASRPEALHTVRRFVVEQVLEPVAASLGRDRPALRAELLGAQLVGVAFARHVVGLPHLQDLDLEELVALVAPSAQRYLTGDLPGA